jgi:hypothetical protein
VLRDLDTRIAANEERIRDFDAIKVQIEACHLPHHAIGCPLSTTHWKRAGLTG